VKPAGWAAARRRAAQARRTLSGSFLQKSSLGCPEILDRAITIIRDPSGPRFLLAPDSTVAQMDEPSGARATLRLAGNVSLKAPIGL
jgi:hypothetical protein